MNEFKKWTATGLALSLCLTLAACSSDDASTSTDDTSTPAASSTDTGADSTETAADDTAEEGTEEATDDSAEEATDDAAEEAADEATEESADGEVSLDSYLEELMAFSEEVALVEEKLVESGDTSEGIPSDEAAIDFQIEIMTSMSDALATSSNITAPDEIADLHADFVAATEGLVDAAVATCEFLADGFDPEDEESVATYSELSEAYLVAYGPLSESLIAIMDELEAQMS